MLKKKNIFVAILSFIFCLSMFGVTLNFDKSNDQGAVVVAATADMPTFEEGDDEGDVNGPWFYDIDTGVLTLNGVSWTETLVVSSNLKIELKGTNSIDVTSSEENSENAIVVEESVEVEIYGSGSLELKSEATVILFENASDVSSVFELGEGVTAQDANKLPISTVDAIASTTGYVKFEGTPVPEQPVEEHEHSFTYSAVGNKLVATCENVDGNCSLQDCQISLSLSIDDFIYGENVDFTLGSGSELAEFNRVTGLNLTKSNFEGKYFKVDEDSQATGGEECISSNKPVGIYRLEVTTDVVSVSSSPMKAYFNIEKAEVEITTFDRDITYNGLKYDVSEMFSVEEDMGTVTYSATTDGLSGETDIASVEIDGDRLTINKCGKINIKIHVAGNDNYKATEKVATLTIDRANLAAGSEEGQIYIIISAGFDGSGNELNAIGWREREDLVNDPHPIPELRNLPQIQGYTFNYNMTYWLDDGFSIPTTTEHRASGENGMPELMGKYYIKAVIEESDLYNAITVSREFEIKRPMDIGVNPSIEYLTYKDIVDGKIDLSDIFVVEDYEQCEDAIDYVEYSYEVEESQYGIISGSLFAISEISDAENGDTYSFRAAVIAKDESLYISSGFVYYDVVIKKVTVDLGDVSLDGKVYDGKPCEVAIENEEDFDEISMQYYLDEGCTTPVTENGGIPVNAGEYFVKISIAETRYTKETEEVFRFAIAHKEIEIVWSEDNFVYNGHVQEIEAYYLDVNKQRVDLNVSIDGEFKNVKADNATYEAIVSFANSETNYVLPEINYKSYRMNPMEIELRISERTSKYGRDGLPLDVVIQKGEIFGDELYSLSLEDDIEITSQTEVGRYKINIALSSNINYDINVVNRDSAYYYVMNYITTTNMIENWTYLETASVPQAEDVLGSQIEFTYYTYNVDPAQRELLSGKPELPGLYYLYANVESSNVWESAYKEELFEIDKIEVSVPPVDTTVYVFNGDKQTYKIEDIDNENKKLYTVGETSFRDAGTHKVRLEIKNYDLYRWPNGEKVYEFDFVINKKSIAKPAADTRVYKYNGNYQTYTLAAGIDYEISKNVSQKEVGRYKITVSLLEPNNTMWSDGTTDNLEYEFVINQNQITEATVLDAEGNKIDKNEVLIISVSQGGLSPDVSLKAEIFDADDKEELQTIKAQLGLLLKKYDKIFKVTDVSLILNGQSIQPENSITLKMLVPEELVNANFKLYHIHIDEKGKEIISEIDYSDVDANGYIVFQTDKLSSFVFVYEQSSLVGLIITFACLAVLMLALLVVQIIWFVKNRKTAKVVTASAVPVFYVAGEVASSITLGVIFGLLFVANVVMLILNLKSKKKKVEVSEQKTTKKTEKTTTQKTEKKVTTKTK